jgi:hypothetical protein
VKRSWSALVDSPLAKTLQNPFAFFLRRDLADKPSSPSRQEVGDEFSGGMGFVAE